MKMLILKRLIIIPCIWILMSAGLFAKSSYNEAFENSSTSLIIWDRGDCRIENGVFKSKDSYACFGNKDWDNYTITFKARAPHHAEQVQIWAGFRAYNRFDRYIIGLKGGLQDDLYLSRMGYMGADELLDLCPLDFHPIPGEWYHFKIEVCGNRIRVFLNNESLPRIDVEDENGNLAPSGYVTLGGGWIDTEFDDLTIETLEKDALKNIPVKKYGIIVSEKEKETQRISERNSYKPVVINKLNADRTEISLDGNWLFLPDYEAKATSWDKPATDDQDGHIMTVPSFWNPIRIWLHGETMNQGKFPKGTSDTYYQKETARCEAYTFDYKKIQAAWYRQWLELPAGIENKTSELVFDAISKMASIYVNGTFVTSHVGMFGEIKADVSGLLKPGKNLIAVYVTKDFTDRNEQPDYYSIARLDEDPGKSKELAAATAVTSKILKDIAHGFYGGSPAGIWQPVKLVVTNPVKIEDVFIRPSLTGATFDVTIKNNSDKKAKFNLSTEIIEDETRNLLHKEESVAKIELQRGEEKTVTYTIDRLKPRLWSPQSPNLYDFKFIISSGKGKDEDVFTVRSGFRTFESKNGLFYLNGAPYWLRGGNQTPFALAPNDSVLANSFYQIMKAGNMDVTRTHTSPYNKLWTHAADKNGIGISHEGTWTWLMINTSMPDRLLIEMWADEYLGLLKKYRNHPSILFWTINNEMKFYDNEPDPEMRKTKMKIISDVVKRMREIDPTRPISFDSNYRRNIKKHGEDFYKDIDDGDIDDIHSYVNWYDHSVFKHFNGEFQRDHKNEGRPLISQEMSTGYPDNDTGHATRFYTLVHQTPQTLVGYQAYDFGNPETFLKVQSFITGELAEALRRSNDKASGIIHFALITWFRNVYDAKTIEPYPTYYAMQRAMSPVLVSAELWGRNFYAGEKLPARICVVNDLESGNALKPLLLHWQIETGNGKIITHGKENIPAVKHYGREWITLNMHIPADISDNKVKAKLKLRLTEDGKQVSANEYDILLAKRDWAKTVQTNKKIVLVDNNDISSVFDALNIKYQPVRDISSALKSRADLIVLSGNTDIQEIKNIKDYISNGGKVLMLNNEETVKTIFPEYVTGWLVPTEGDIVNMEIPESPVFDDIDLLELRYFNNNKREIPVVCRVALQLNRNENVEELASHTKIHGYVQGNMEQRVDYMKTIKGFPIVKIREGKGEALISTMSHEKSSTDPVAARLLANMINSMIN